MPDKVYYMGMIALIVLTFTAVYTTPKFFDTEFFGPILITATPFIAVIADLELIPYSFWGGFGISGYVMGAIGYAMVTVVGMFVGLYSRFLFGRRDLRVN